MLISFNYFAQKDSILPNLRPEFQTCEDGVKEALSNFENNDLILLSYGYPLRNNLDFNDFYIDYMKKNYAIVLGNGGCIVSDYSECYSNKMYKLITSKYGKNIFEVSKNEALIEYDSLINNKIESNFIFSEVDSLPNYPGGKNGLFEYLSKNISNPDNLEGKVITSLIIEKDGSISKVLIRKGLSEKTDDEVKDVFSKMPKWNPPILKGKYVRMYFSVPIELKKN